MAFGIRWARAAGAASLLGRRAAYHALAVDRLSRAVVDARHGAVGTHGRRLTCPSLAELCQKAGDYRTFAEVARESADPVHFLAGLLAARR